MKLAMEIHGDYSLTTARYQAREHARIWRCNTSVVRRTAPGVIPAKYGFVALPDTFGTYRPGDSAKAHRSADT